MKTSRAIVFAAAAAVLASCATFVPPKGYVPDDKVVYLRERLELEPIRYNTFLSDPYVFAPDNGPVKAEAPAFLSLSKFDLLLKPGLAADSRLYREVVAHLQYVETLPAYLALKARLDAADIQAPPPLPPNVGGRTQEYTNGNQFNYPDAPGAFITVLNDGQYFIDFPDKSSFKYYKDGSYARFDAAGKEVSGFDKQDGSATMQDGDAVFTAWADFRRVASPQGTVEYATSPTPQHHYAFPKAKEKDQYTFFEDKDGKRGASSFTNAAGIRFDFFPADQDVLVTSGAQAVQIGPDFAKQHAVFDQKTRKAGDLLSAFLPEGLRLANLSGQGLSYGDLEPSWPEDYKSAKLGPFRILYTAKDAPLLAKLSAQRLSEVEAGDRKLTGLDAVANRTLIIPPDLKSYAKLHAQKPGSALFWYPSGFETKDYIVMWPISVPRYASPLGQAYFFEHEFYEILAHEYVHLLVGENAGLAGSVPVWLNEGYAVYAESQFSPDCKAYWELAFQVDRDRRILLSWDDAATKSTGEFPAPQARTHYAQSYALVNALMAKYGAAKIDAYIKSFKARPEDAEKADMKKLYRTNFKNVFGIDFDEALKLLAPAR